jgi:hypothetical protein
MTPVNHRTALRSLVLALALLVGVVFSPSRAIADKLHLKDGRVLEGTVAKEVSGYVWFKVKVGNLESEQLFKPDEIEKIERDGGDSPQDKAAAADQSDKPAAESKPRSGVPRIAVITLGEGGDKDMVGLFITADSLKRIVPLLEQEHVTDVVFRVNSGGGALLEIQKLSDEIQNEYKQKFRVVAWIQSAISAAAMTSHCIEDIYLMKTGNYGACTGWYGQLTAVKGRELQEVLYMMEKISARGKHDPKIMRSMQIMDPLSCSIDENGDVHWYQNLDGDFIVNPKERILCFNAEDAVKYKFAKGIAEDIDTLAHEMGYTEYELVGKNVPGVPYPVCRAEEEMRKFRDQTFDDQKRTNEYLRDYQQSIQVAQSSPPEDRGKFVARARQDLDKLRRMVKNNPNFALFVFNRTPEQLKDWFAQQEELLRRLTRK